jgi:hypothetical protein
MTLVDRVHKKIATAWEEIDVLVGEQRNEDKVFIKARDKALKNCAGNEFLPVLTKYRKGTNTRAAKVQALYDSLFALHGLLEHL